MTRRLSSPMEVGTLDTLLSSALSRELQDQVVQQLLASLPFRGLLESPDHVSGWHFGNSAALCVPSRAEFDIGEETRRPMLIVMMRTLAVAQRDTASAGPPLLRLGEGSSLHDGASTRAQSKVSFLPTDASTSREPSTLSLRRGRMQTFSEGVTVCGVDTEDDGLVVILAAENSYFGGNVHKMHESMQREAVERLLKILSQRQLFDVREQGPVAR